MIHQGGIFHGYHDNLNMNFTLTENQSMIQAAAREFAQNEIAPVAAQFDASGDFPKDTIRKAGELGFMGVEVPEEYGGAGALLSRRQNHRNLRGDQRDSAHRDRPPGNRSALGIKGLRVSSAQGER
jgi:hypothetical protein